MPSPASSSPATHYSMPGWSVQTNRETMAPGDIRQASQFETLATYNDAIRERPQLSDLRWALVPGSMRHMDRFLDSPTLNPPAPTLPSTFLPGLANEPNAAWVQNVVGVNNQLLDVTWGSLVRGNVQGVPQRPQPDNWNVNQPGLAPSASRASSNYVTLW